MSDFRQQKKSFQERKNNMGYRSEVCIALTDNATRLLKAIIQHLPEQREALSLLEEDVATFIDITPADILNSDFDCDSKIYFESVKWYDNHECVSFIQDFLQQLDEEDYLFTRLGEETDDMEQTGGYWDSDVRISRVIQW